MNRTAGFVAGLGAACVVAVSAAYAEPVTSPEQAIDVITSVTATTSKPFYNGSYFKIEVTATETCTLVKTLTDYSADDEKTKTVETTYDVAQIDPAKISADGLGGVKFWSLGEATVFPMETKLGGNFSAMLPGDSLTVRDEAAETPMIIEALTYLSGHCSG